MKIETIWRLTKDVPGQDWTGELVGYFNTRLEGWARQKQIAGGSRLTAISVIRGGDLFLELSSTHPIKLGLVADVVAERRQAAMNKLTSEEQELLGLK